MLKIYFYGTFRHLEFALPSPLLTLKIEITSSVVATPQCTVKHHTDMYDVEFCPHFGQFVRTVHNHNHICHWHCICCNSTPFWCRNHFCSSKTVEVMSLWTPKLLHCAMRPKSYKQRRELRFGDVQYLSKRVVHFDQLFLNIGEWFLKLSQSYFISFQHKKFQKL